MPKQIEMKRGPVVSVTVNGKFLMTFTELEKLTEALSVGQRYGRNYRSEKLEFKGYDSVSIELETFNQDEYIAAVAENNLEASDDN